MILGVGRMRIELVHQRRLKGRLRVLGVKEDEEDWAMKDWVDGRLVGSFQKLHLKTEVAGLVFGLMRLS